jgi:hypothetical protein
MRQIVRAGAGVKAPGAAHLLLTDDLLAVANGGRAMSREAIAAMCGTARSSKTKADQQPVASAVDVQTVLRDIRTRTLRQFRANPDLIGASIRNESNIGAELRQRALMELLQNAGDAMGGPAIGKKGLGFRCVAAITDAPRIHSGVASFCFDRARTLRQIEARKIPLADGAVPLLRLPFLSPREAEPDAVKALIAAFTTVIVLPLRDAAAREAVCQQWEGLRADITLIRHFPGLRRVVWQRADATETMTRTWTLDGRGAVKVADDGREARPRPIVIRQPKRGGAAAAGQGVKPRMPGT